MTATATDTATLAPAGLIAALEQIHIDPTEWSATIGPRDLSANDSASGLRHSLIGAMYEVLHAGRAEEKDLGRIVREPDIEEILLSAIPHQSSPRTGRVLAKRDEETLIDLGDVRVLVPAHHLPEDLTVDEVRTLLLPAARPALSHGFLMVDGPRGMPRSDAGLRRLYVHATDPDSAAAAWRVSLEALNENGVPYRSKTLSHRDGYPRRDAIVIYLPMEEAAGTAVVAGALADQPGIAPDTSLFAHAIAPGIAVADDPRDPRAQYRDLSFGEHRSAIATNALIRSVEEPGADLADLFVQECRKAHVDPEAPAYNAIPA